MNIYISIDGVLRNFVNRFHYHYENAYINVDDDEESTDTFEYKVIEPITNLNLTDHFIFQSKDQSNHFPYIEYPMELYGHSPVSYPNVYNEFNKFVFVQNSQPELLTYHNKAHVGKPNVPCILLCCVWLVYSIGGCRPRWLLSPEVELLRQVNSALLLWGNVISACEIYSIDLSTAYSRKNSIPVFDVMGV